MASSRESETSLEPLLSKGLQKYPRTPHLPFSPGVSHDDIVLTCATPLLSQETVLTEKLDGGNCSIFQGKVYARTVGAEASHPSFGPIKQLASQVHYLLPDNIQLFGENMFVLEDGFKWWSWDHMTELANEIGVPTVPMETRQYVTSMDVIQSLIRERMSHKSNCGSCTPEGFVLRTTAGFSYKQLDSHIAKYVRSGHVQTDESWRRTWKQAKLA